MTPPRNSRRLLGALLLGLLFAGAILLLATTPAAAQDATTMTGDALLSPVEERRLRFLFWAYNAIWVLLGGFLVTLALRLRAVHDEVRRLKARLEETASRGRPGAP